MASELPTADRGMRACGLLRLAHSRISAHTVGWGAWILREQSLRTSHRVLIGALTTDGAGALSITSSGEVGIEHTPIFDAVKSTLVDSGMGFAANIPTVDRTIVIAQSEVLRQIRTAYAVAVAFWLPWLAPVVVLLIALLPYISACLTLFRALPSHTSRSCTRMRLAVVRAKTLTGLDETSTT